MEILNSYSERKARIAVVDDDAEIRQTLRDLLHDNGFDPVILANSREFHALGANPALDLVLIDLKLQGESGLALAMRIRETLGLPIVMLTGVGDEIDKIVGLETGADDYLMKPFNPRELVARIRAVLRRSGRHFASDPLPVQNDSAVLTFGDKTVDTAKRELRDSNGEEISLTNAEYRLLEYFLQHPDETVTRAKLLEHLGSDLSRYVDRTVDVLILRLRRKIEAVPSKPVHLLTRRGRGYVFVVHPAA